MVARRSTTAMSRVSGAHTAPVVLSSKSIAPSRVLMSTRPAPAGASGWVSAKRDPVFCCASSATARPPRLRYPHSDSTYGGHMSERRPVHEEPRLEDHKVYALLAIPVFLVTILIIVLLAIFGTSPGP